MIRVFDAFRALHIEIQGNMWYNIGGWTDRKIRIDNRKASQ